MRMVDNQKKILITLLLAISALSLVAVSYAYFSASINQKNAQEVNLTAATLRMTFADNDAGVNASLKFGESATKLFTIENTGTLPVTGKISWLNLINTYLNGSLTYTLSYSETQSGTYTEVVTNENVPVSSTSTTKILADGLIVPNGKKYYYKLVITLNGKPDTDQTSDLSAKFGTKFTLAEGTSQ